jgi:hypothetical protein
MKRLERGEGTTHVLSRVVVAGSGDRGETYEGHMAQSPQGPERKHGAFLYTVAEESPSLSFFFEKLAI